MVKQLNAKQKRFLSDLEKCEKTVDLIFQDHAIPPDVLGEWLLSRPFNRAIESMRKRMNFRLEHELLRGAVLGAARIASAAGGSGGFAKAVELGGCVNAIKLFHAVVKSPQLKRRAAVIAARAAALLARIGKEQDRAARLDRDQDENGKWMPAD